jgi:hypothetical protein
VTGAHDEAEPSGPKDRGLFKEEATSISHTPYVVRCRSP